MSEITFLIEQCRGYGAEFVLAGSRVRVRAPNALPENLLNELRSRKPEVIALLQGEAKAFGCSVLERWRRDITPEWRRILSEAIAASDVKREAYARWMLRDILVDPEYWEHDSD